MKTLTPLALTALLLAPACSFGPRQVRVSTELAPSGARVVFPVAKRVLAGELIAVQEGRLFVLVDPPTGGLPELVFVARTDVGYLRKFETSVGGLSGRPDATLWERLRLASRHPQGLDEELLERLLQSLGQQGPTPVTP